MKLFVTVRSNSKESSVAKDGEGKLTLRVKAPAKEGKANKAVIELLSEYFDIPKSRITILKGLASKNKVVSVT